MGEAHKVQRQQHTCHGGRPGAAGQAAHKAPGQRHQQHTKQRARKAPAKGRHAKQRNAQHDKILAQRRVGRFVHRQAVQLLVPRAAMVDLVEIHAVQLADGLRYGVLLIKQGPTTRYRHQRAVRIAERQLKQLRVFHRNVENFARVGVQFHRCPAEAGAVVQFFLINGRACSVGHGHPPTVGDARVHPQRRCVPLQGHRFAQGRVGGIQRVLRCGKAAQVRKAYHSSRRRQRQHGQQLFSLPLGLGGRYCGGCRLLSLAGGQRQSVVVNHNIPHRKQQQHKTDSLGQADQNRHAGAGRAGQPFVIGAGQAVDGT